MLLTVLGCSGSAPGPESPASGYLVRDGDTAVVLDLGNGTLGALQRHLDPSEITALALSHLHPDHCSDASSLVVWLRYHPERMSGARPGRRLPVYGPAGTPRRLAAAYAPDEAELRGTDLSDVFDFRPLSALVEPGEPARIGSVRLRATPVHHLCESYALRVSAGGRMLVYSGDTGPCDGLVEAARGADVLLAEASWPHRPDNPKGLHLSGQEAGEAASAAGVGRLLLTHVPPWCDGEQLLAEAKAVFDGPVELVRPDADYPV